MYDVLIIGRTGWSYCGHIYAGQVARPSEKGVFGGQAVSQKLLKTIWISGISGFEL